MDIKKLELFLGVADAGSVSLASKNHFISQSALTRQIQLLERELDTALFERSARGVVLTRQGEILRRSARALIEQIHLVKSELGAVRNEPSGDLTLGMTPSIREILGARLITRYFRAYPKVRIEVLEGLSGTLAKAVSAGALDCAIFVGEDGSGLPVAIHRIKTEPVVVVTQPSAGLSMDKPVSLEWVTERPLIIARSNRVSLGLDRECALRGLHMDLVMDIQAIHLSLALAHDGVASLIVPYSAAAIAVRDGTVCAAPIESFTTTWAVGWSAEHAPNLATQRLIEMIKQEAMEWSASSCLGHV